MDREVRVLLIEDVATDAELELRELRKSGMVFVSRRVDNEQDLRRELLEFRPEVILSDYSLSGSFDGRRALAISQELAPDTPFIFVSGTIGEENAIDSLKSGATDYILKTNLLRLSNAVLRALEESELRKLQKKAEREMEEQRAFLRKVIDLDKSMIFAKDREGRFVLANEAVANVFGVPVSDLMGKTNADFIPDPEMVRNYQRDEMEVMETKTEKFFPEVKIKDVSGKTRWLQTVLSPIISADGNANMILAVGTDITERKKMEDELRQSIERFETISKATNDAVWDWDIVTGKLWWNESFKSLFGYREDEIEPHIDFWERHIHPDDRENVSRSLHQVFEGNGQYWNDEYRFMRRDGSYAYVYDRGYVMRDGNGKGVRMIGAMTDISDRYEQDMKIARLNRIHEVLSSINSTIVRVHDRDTLCNEACRIAVQQGKFAMAWIGMVDEDADEIRRVAIHGNDYGYLDTVRFSLDENIPEGKSLVSSALRQNRVKVADNIAVTPEIDVRFRRALSERGFRSLAVLPLNMAGKAVGTFTLYSHEIGAFDEAEMKLLSEMAADISFALEYIHKEHQLNYLAYYDVLTGLPNRNLFGDRLAQVFHSASENRIAGLLLMDIEHFAYINDVYGRHVGDAVLKEITGVLRNIIPEQDHLARVGPNCFAVLLAEINHPSAIAHFIEEKLYPAVSAPVAVEGQTIKLSGKAGVAISPDDGTDVEVLFRNAEAALKSAKQHGNKYVFYASEMNARVAEKLTLETRLRYALEKEEFILYYQPKINLGNGQVCGLEALIRWNSKEGLVPPVKFIPLLEETGMIVEAGLWVIKKAMQDRQSWRKKGLTPPRIAVNVSPVQIREKDFVKDITDILDKFPEEKSGLEIEITESLIMENLKENISKLARLREYGIQISIDDFGTGYSSLSYMSKLPVNALKIDRAFITAMLNNPDDTSIISAIISLAHSLNLSVIAEGVETLEQANLLKLLRCDEFQGYLFSPPVPPLDIESMLSEHKSFA
jgi:diguanylate cyclase (GGDEF)-like protein/PAS domain S-box-containing protein